MRTSFKDRFKSEDGNVTIFACFLVITFLMLGGYAVDVSGMATESVRLQVAVDSAAHAALLKREVSTVEEARTRAIDLVETNLPPGYYGDVVHSEEIVFGVWDEDTLTFTADPASGSAVQVTARRTTGNDNPMNTYLWKVIGVDTMDLVARSIYTTYDPSCFREGFVAQGVVDIQSNNSFTNGFCVHSNTYVSLNSNNYFEAGTVVSMPDLATIDLPNSGFATNLGLNEALRVGSYNLRILARVSDIIDNIADPDSLYRPDYLTTNATYTLTANRIDETDFVEGALHYWNCSGGSGGTLNMARTPIKNVVIVANCEVSFGSNAQLQNVLFLNTSTSATSFRSPAGLQVGLDDHCADGGGAQLVTLGGMNFAANLSMYGGQLLAVGDISFSANANGIEGAAIVAGGVITGTSNMAMAFCGTGMDDNLTAKYFRMVE